LATSFQLIAKHLNVLLPQTNKQTDQDNFNQNTHKIKINPNHNPARMLSTQITNMFFTGGWNAFAGVRERRATEGEQGRFLIAGGRNRCAEVRETVSGRGRRGKMKR
jgi:hypothetical protein